MRRCYLLLWHAMWSGACYTGSDLCYMGLWPQIRNYSSWSASSMISWMSPKREMILVCSSQQQHHSADPYVYIEIEHDCLILALVGLLWLPLPQPPIDHPPTSTKIEHLCSNSALVGFSTRQRHPPVATAKLPKSSTWAWFCCCNTYSSYTVLRYHQCT